MRFHCAVFKQIMEDIKILLNKKRGWDKSPSLSIVFGLSSKTQWLSVLYYADFISFYSPTQLCGGRTTKSNSNELPISVPLSFCLFIAFITDNKAGFLFAGSALWTFISSAFEVATVLV